LSAASLRSPPLGWANSGKPRNSARRARKKHCRDCPKEFIENASRLYLDALEHNTTEISKLVDIYSTLNRMRVLSSPQVVAAADSALPVIVEVYANENATFAGIRQSIEHGFLDPLRPFSEACHEELKGY
jgi:hypothetical protein